MKIMRKEKTDIREFLRELKANKTNRSYGSIEGSQCNVSQRSTHSLRLEAQRIQRNTSLQEVNLMKGKGQNNYSNPIMQSHSYINEVKPVDANKYYPHPYTEFMPYGNASYQQNYYQTPMVSCSQYYPYQNGPAQPTFYQGNSNPYYSNQQSNSFSYPPPQQVQAKPTTYQQKQAMQRSNSFNRLGNKQVDKKASLNHLLMEQIEQINSKNRLKRQKTNKSNLSVQQKITEKHKATSNEKEEDEYQSSEESLKNNNSLKNSLKKNQNQRQNIKMQSVTRNNKLKQQKEETEIKNVQKDNADNINYKSFMLVQNIIEQKAQEQNCLSKKVKVKRQYKKNKKSSIKKQTTISPTVAQDKTSSQRTNNEFKRVNEIISQKIQTANIAHLLDQLLLCSQGIFNDSKQIFYTNIIIEKKWQAIKKQLKQLKQ